ncbi:MAG: hypothetical protein V3W32_05870 [Gemmatimonadota bacterium]
MSELKTWSTTAGGNDDGSPDGAPENMNRTGVNDSMREIMASIRRWYDDPTWVDPFDDYTVTKASANTVRIAGVDATGKMIANRRLKLSGTNPTEYGVVVSSSYGAPDTDVVVKMDGGGAVPAAIDTCEIMACALNVAAYRGVVDASDSLSDTTKLVSIDGFDDVLAQSASFDALGTAALLDAGTDPADLPTAADIPGLLGTAAVKDHGTDAGEVPLNSDLGELSKDDRPYRKVVPITTQTSNSTTSAYWSPADWTGVAIAAANSSKYFRVTVQAWIDENTDDSIDWCGLHIGATGDDTDPKFGQAAGPSHPHDDQANFWDDGDDKGAHVSCIVQPASGDKVTFAIQNDAGATARRIQTAGAGGAPQKSLLIIEEIIGEE